MTYRQANLRLTKIKRQLMLSSDAQPDFRKVLHPAEAFYQYDDMGREERG